MKSLDWITATFYIERVELHDRHDITMTRYNVGRKLRIDTFIMKLPASLPKATECPPSKPEEQRQA
jgi:hypothetical protein